MSFFFLCRIASNAVCGAGCIVISEAVGCVGSGEAVSEAVSGVGSGEAVSFCLRCFRGLLRRILYCGSLRRFGKKKKTLKRRKTRNPRCRKTA